MESDKRLDLAHLQRVAAILDGIPSDTDLPHALIALEDAMVACTLALQMGLSLERARDLHREQITREETRRLLAEHCPDFSRTGRTDWITWDERRRALLALSVIQAYEDYRTK